MNFLHKIFLMSMIYKYSVFAYYKKNTLDSRFLLNDEENYNTSGIIFNSNIIIFFTIVLSSCFFLLLVRFIYKIINMCDSHSRYLNIIANATLVTNNIENVDVRVIEDFDEAVETTENVLVATEVPFSRGSLLR